MRKFFCMTVLLTLIVLAIPLVIQFGLWGPEQQKIIGNLTVRVLNSQSGEVKQMPLERYLVGVVGAEMPANFEIEALKAQAIAARTYTVKRMLKYGGLPNDKHPAAEVCTDPGHCQAWLNEDELKKKWNSIEGKVFMQKVQNAVNSTAGLVITYQGKLIDPVYSASCGGKGTEEAEDVWNHPIPYLKATTCPYEYALEKQQFSFMAPKELLRTKLGVSEQSTSSPVFKVLETSTSGRVREAQVFGQKFDGNTLRQVLGLTSTMIDFKVNGNQVTVSSLGKGHAVGMCQYGANGLALKGYSFNAILKHYYTGVEIKKIGM